MVASKQPDSAMPAKSELNDAERWLLENKHAVESANEYVRRNGLSLERFQWFWDPSPDQTLADRDNGFT